LALRYEKAGRAAAVNYLVVVNAFFFDAFVFGEDIKGTDFMGASCIIVFALLNAALKCFGKTK
jgi:drug/metabolite transporter (DMT)-like permease